MSIGVGHHLFWGLKALDEMSKEELIKALEEVIGLYSETLERHRKDLDFLRTVQKEV